MGPLDAYIVGLGFVDLRAGPPRLFLGRVHVGIGAFHVGSRGRQLVDVVADVMGIPRQRPASLHVRQFGTGARHCQLIVGPVQFQ